MMLSTNPFAIQKIKSKAADSKIIGTIKEAQVLMNQVMVSSKIIGSAFGRAGSKFICNSFNIDDYDIERTPGSAFSGVIVYFCFDALYEYLSAKTTDKIILRIINRAIKIAHKEINLFRGKIYTHEVGSYFAVWSFEENMGVNEVPPTWDNLEYKRFLKQKMQARMELAFSAIFSAVFKIKIFVREYMHHKHQKVNLKAEYVVGFAIHAGSGYEGPAGASDKVDMVICGADVTLCRKISELNPGYKSDILMTEFACELLSVETRRQYLHEVDRYLIKGEELSGNIHPIKLYTTVFDEKKIGNFVITKHISAMNTNGLVEMIRNDVLRLRISECHFSELCPNLKNYAFQNLSLQHIYNEALKYYYKREWQLSNSHLERMIRFIKDFTPAIILKKKLMAYNNICPLNWTNYHTIDIYSN